MTVKDLIGILEKMDPEALVVREGYDHSYEEVYFVGPAKAEAAGGYLGEYFGELFHDGTVLNVVLLE